MKPKFKNQLAWEQAEIIMQPAFIRVIDNLRKEVEKSDWKGTYEEITEPIPGYQLCLTRKNQSVRLDLWDLCFQVCFSNYYFSQTDIFRKIDPESYEVEIDTRLIDETGDVDWQFLETKVQELVKQIFDNLPDNN